MMRLPGFRYRAPRTIADAAAWLRPGGALVLEIGTGQGAAVVELLAAGGLTDVAIGADLAGHDRIVQARLPVRSA